jgi:tetratricopeptide (TPR) repeat protein
MDKIVYNCTQGGAKIQGCEQMLLKDMIAKHCTKVIDKSKIKPLLSYAKDGDELISKVLPLLKKDIENLDEIIIKSGRGLAANRGLKNLMQRKSYKNLLPTKKARNFDRILIETNNLTKGDTIKTNIMFYEKVIMGLKKCKLKNIMILSYKNFMASEAAHMASKMNPLVNVAIYGASRKIQGRALKVNQSINNFLKNPKDALIRIERNTLILTTARDAAKSLKKSYKKTYKVLKKYDIIKDDSLLVSNEIEEINLDDAETYFEAGNWAHPLLDCIKFKNKIREDPVRNIANIKYKEYDNYGKIYDKAIKMKNEAIQKAKDYEKENEDHDRKLLKYNDLLEEAKKIGREEQKFPEALELIKKAADFLPEETEARWGLATAFHHSGLIDESLKEYKKLIKDFPDNYLFAFEYGQVLLTNGKIKEGLKQISGVMQKTEEYDNFFARIGAIYEHLDMKKEAINAYSSYLKKFPYDFKVWAKKGDCLLTLGKNQMAENAFKKALKIKPDYKEAMNKMILGDL